MKSMINLDHDSLELMNARYGQKKKLSSVWSLVLTGPVKLALYGRASRNVCRYLQRF
jgi:hypothetical protein